MKYFKVEADVVTPTQITFECPYCWSKYKKNGDPYKTAKRVRHIHGNDTHSNENRTTTRTPHCLRIGEFNEFLIEITENTIRKGF
tara:strand:- start:505 stop:759 length:255 start_codon:yes stop_codon:yes gene_type:complete